MSDTRMCLSASWKAILPSQRPSPEQYTDLPETRCATLTHAANCTLCKMETYHSSATAPASPKGAYSWCSTSCIPAVVRILRPRYTVHTPGHPLDQFLVSPCPVTRCAELTHAAPAHPCARGIPFVLNIKNPGECRGFSKVRGDARDYLFSSLLSSTSSNSASTTSSAAASAEAPASSAPAPAPAAAAASASACACW